MVNESSFEIGIKPVIEGSRQVLAKLVLFQLDGNGHPQDSAMPSFFLGSRGSILGLSIDVEFVSKFFWKGGENLKRVKMGANIYGGPCTAKNIFFFSFWDCK